MKTTVDLPEDLLHRAKITAAQRKITLRELVVQGLEYATSHSNDEPIRQLRNQDLLDSLAGIQITEPVGRLNREETHDRQRGRWE